MYESDDEKRLHNFFKKKSSGTTLHTCCSPAYLYKMSFPPPLILLLLRRQILLLILFSIMMHVNKWEKRRNNISSIICVFVCSICIGNGLTCPFFSAHTQHFRTSLNCILFHGGQQHKKRESERKLWWSWWCKGDK